MVEKKNILFILHVPPPVHGSSMVGKTIKESNLINSSFECRYINMLMSRTISETGKPDLAKIFRFFGVWFTLLREIIKKKPDICYLALTATGAAFYKDFLLVILLRIFRIKRVYHLHNKGIHQNHKKKVNEWLYRFVFHNSSVILLTKQLYYEVESFVPTSKVFICPNGIKDSVGRNIPRSTQQVKPVKILFLSNLNESKGVYVLLKACEILREKRFDFECNFVGGEGDISKEQFNKQLTGYNLNKQVNYLGQLFGEEKQQAFAAADIFAFPTCYETFGLVNLEAMQNYLPVVSTFEGGIPDVVENGVTGFLIPTNNAEALAGKLEVLIKNPDLRSKMGKAGRLKYENEYTQEVFEQNLYTILHQLTE